jgi:hypothetical protein
VAYGRSNGSAKKNFRIGQVAPSGNRSVHAAMERWLPKQSRVAKIRTINRRATCAQRLHEASAPEWHEDGQAFRPVTLDGKTEAAIRQALATSTGSLKVARA